MTRSTPSARSTASTFAVGGITAAPSAWTVIAASIAGAVAVDPSDVARLQPLRSNMARRTREGKTEREATRCLKRFIARRVWRLLEHPELQLDKT